jgi:tRNA(Arg) A34 adenosine deaminase TadA
MVSAADLELLRMCVDLARQALEAGDAPFGSVLVDSDGKIVQTDRNRTVTGGDATLHPEFTLARWAQLNMTAADRAAATVYTSGEHCAMCSAAHAYVGLGRIVYASSTAQLVSWMDASDIKSRRVNPLAIADVAPGIPTEGPVPELAEQIKELQQTAWSRKAGGGQMT